MTVSKDWDKNRENERLIGEKKSDDSRSCRRQILASFIGKSLFYIIHHNTYYSITKLKFNIFE